MTTTELLRLRAEEYGDRLFITGEDGDHSYRAIHERAGAVAANLAARGVGKGSKVLTLCGNSVAFIELFLGLGRIGAVLVPVNPTLKPEEVVYIATNAEADTLVIVPPLLPMLPALREGMPGLQRVFVIGGEAGEGVEPFSALQEPVAELPPIAAEPEDDAALIYTSGTTGLPKGVVLTHRNYVANARMIIRATHMESTDRFFLVLPLFHVNAQVVSVLAPLMAGADILLMTKFNPFAILPMIEQYRATILSAVPTIYNVICRMPKASEYDVSSIKFFVSGAAPLPEETYRLTQEVLKRPLIMGYGLSEATCASTAADYRDPIKWDSVGPAMRYTSLRIVGDDGCDVPVGEVGEVWVAGPTVMKGYYKDEAATREVLRGGWLATGDLGRIDRDGYVYIVGRKKEMIIRGGQNIYPQQVESVVSRFEGVEECCVVGVEEARWGQEVLAVVKPAEGRTVDPQALMAFCREHLAAYKCPRHVRLVEALPKTATGKIKRGEVAALFADIALS